VNSPASTAGIDKAKAIYAAQFPAAFYHNELSVTARALQTKCTGSQETERNLPWRRADGRRGGCFDVFAWNGGDYLFVEAKRRRKEKIRKSQREWLQAALNTKCKPESFLIFEWDVDDQMNAC
jgi:hypothetical protein